MADISKTAKQAMQAGANQNKEVKTTSPEEMVRVIILNTKQNVFTGNMDYLRALIAAYETERNAVLTLAEATKGLLKRAEDAEAEVAELKKANTWINATNEANSKLIAELQAKLAAAAAIVDSNKGPLPVSTILEFFDGKPSGDEIPPSVEEPLSNDLGNTPAAQEQQDALAAQADAAIEAGAEQPSGSLS